MTVESPLWAPMVAEASVGHGAGVGEHVARDLAGLCAQRGSQGGVHGHGAQ